MPIEGFHMLNLKCDGQVENKDQLLVFYLVQLTLGIS